MTAKKTDKNQAAIVDAFRKCGATVQTLHAVGQGCPDLLVGWQGYNFLIEVKAEKGKLDERQERWHSEWEGTVYIIRDPMKAHEMLVRAKKH